RPVQIAGGQGDHRRQIRGGLVQAQAADDVQVRVAGGDLQAAPLLQHRQQHGEAVVVKAVAGAAGVARRRRHRQRLNLRQHRPCPLHHTGDAGPGG
ncbi:Sporulation protein YabP, partial [Dysosmobacter welbionis]